MTPVDSPGAQQHGEWDLAIDFGTSNTTAAVRIGGVLRTVTFDDNASSMPSAVFALDDGIRTGRSALRQWRLTPSRFEPHPKRRVGDAEVLLGPITTAPSNLVAAVLRVVLARAAIVAGTPRPARVVLTHPQSWSGRKVTVLRAAAAAAGLGDVITITEPIAAARRYETAAPTTAGPVFVFDFGGGTCDVAVLGAPRIGGREVLVAVGDESLGGTDLDLELFEWVMARLESQGPPGAVERIRSPDGLAARLLIGDAVREAKEDLSTHQTATIAIRTEGIDRVLQITRTEFEQLIAPQVQRARELVQEAMDRSRAARGTFSAVYLSGGASQTPAVLRAVRDATGAEPAPFDNPKLVVAEGALMTLAPRSVHDRKRAPVGRILAIVGGALAVLVIGGIALSAALGPGPGPTGAGGGSHAGGSSPGTHTSSDPPATCWTTASSTGSCPPIEGEAGARFAFPALFRDATCQGPTSPGGGVRTLWICSFADQPHSRVYVDEFESHEAGVSYFSTQFQAANGAIGSTDLTSGGGGDTVGVRWDNGWNDPANFAGGGHHAVGGADHRWAETLMLYDKIPYGAWVATDLTDQGTPAEQLTTFQHVDIQPASAIDAALRTVS